MPYRNSGRPNRWKTQNTRYSGRGNPHYRNAVIVLRCGWCGKSVERWEKQIVKHKVKNVWCSTECRKLYTKSVNPPKDPLWRHKRLGDKHPRFTGKKFCKVCSKELVGRDARRLKTCSPECASKNRSVAHSGSNNPRWINKVFACNQCGKEIKSRSRAIRKFCSVVCRGKWQSENRSRENSPLWMGGSSYAVYPPTFNYKLRRSVKDRDGNQCVFCHDHKRLSIHHIDYVKSNCAITNLVTLCTSCHVKTNHNRSYWKDYFQLAMAG